MFRQQLEFWNFEQEFHSSALWSLRRNVRKAQSAFDAEPLKLSASTSSLVM
jgi:hypothetical protein